MYIYTVFDSYSYYLAAITPELIQVYLSIKKARPVTRSTIPKHGSCSAVLGVILLKDSAFWSRM